MPEVRQIIITIRNPSEDGLDPGQVAEAHFTFDGETVVMTDGAGTPITDRAGNGFKAKAEPGTERRVAGRLVREVRARLTLDRHDASGGRIVYPRYGVA